MSNKKTIGIIGAMDSEVEKLSKKLKDAQSVSIGGLTFFSGIQEIREEFHALAVEMEGAAIAQTAVTNHIPFAAIRVVSDLADGKATNSFDLFESKTADLSALIIENLLKTGGF